MLDIFSLQAIQQEFIYFDLDLDSHSETFLALYTPWAIIMPNINTLSKQINEEFVILAML